MHEVNLIVALYISVDGALCFARGVVNRSGLQINSDTRWLMVHADAEVTNKDREGREIMRPRLNRRSEDAISILGGLCEEFSLL